MRKLGLYILVGSSLALLSAHALGGNLEGLEMDVMDANEAPDDAGWLAREHLLDTRGAANLAAFLA